MTNKDLIAEASKVLNPQVIDKKHDGHAANVACAVEAADGQVFTGVCIGGYLSICAEQTALANMLSKTGPVVRRLVAVWRDESDELYALPPCGRCREFLRNIAQKNLEAEIILGKDHSLKLEALFPYPGWHAEKAED